MILKVFLKKYIFFLEYFKLNSFLRWYCWFLITCFFYHVVNVSRKKLMRMKINKMKKVFFSLSKCNTYAKLKSFAYVINYPQKV